MFLTEVVGIPMLIAFEKILTELNLIRVFFELSAENLLSRARKVLAGWLPEVLRGRAGESS